jgi:hypothetical protein
MPQTTQPCASSNVVGSGSTSAGTIINGGLIAVTLKNDGLFAHFGVTDHSSIGAQQVVQDRCTTGRAAPTGAGYPAVRGMGPVPFGPTRHELRRP